MYRYPWIGVIALLCLLVNIFSDFKLFLITSYIAFGIYALSKLVNDKTVLNWFRLAIVGYSICSIGFNPDFKLGISICALLAFILCPVSSVDRNKMTWNVLWQAVSVGVIASVISVFTAFDEMARNRVDVWIFGHYVFFGTTYIICFLLANPKTKKQADKTSAKVDTKRENTLNAQLTSKEDSLRLPIYGIIVIIISVILIYNLSKPKVTANHSSYPVSNAKTVQVQEEQKPYEVEEKTNWEYLLNSQGKYGSFSTLLNKDTILSEKNVFSATIVDSYDKCTEKMPYCEKYRRIFFDCDAKVFVVIQELTEKNGKIVKEIEHDSKKAPIRSLSESKIITNVFNEVCRSYLEQQKKNVQPQKIAPTPNYTPQYSKPSYSVPSSRYKAACRDGTYSYSRGRGTCSHHGGVAYYL